MKNDADSTVLYTSEERGRIDPDSGFNVFVYGKDIYGNPVPVTDTISAADLANAGIVNDYEKGYKLRVNQWWVPEQVQVMLEGINAVYFYATQSRYFNTNNFSDNWGRMSFFYSWVDRDITMVKNDPLIMYRWQLAYKNNRNEILNDTGELFIPRPPFVYYGMLENGKDYSVRLTGQLDSGMKLDAGWHDFSVRWTDNVLEHGHLTAYYVRDTPAIFVRLSMDDGYTLPSPQKGWDLYRIETETGKIEHAGIIPPGQDAIYDFGAKNNTEYHYKVYYAATNVEGYTLSTERPIKMRYYWNWAIIETEAEETEYMHYPFAGNVDIFNKMYHVKRVHQFQANVDSGSISNENTPYVENNFTPYPTVQKVGRKGLSGKLRAWVGGVKDTQFRDSVKMVDDLMDLSTRNTVKFLRDRKGNLRMIEISDAIVKETQDKYAEQPVQIEIPWVEVGDAKDCQIVSLLTDGLMARGDDIIDTTTAISVDQDGFVTWTMDPDGYIGSEIQMNDGGQLEQVYDNSMKYVPADLEINNEGKLKVETVIKADE